MGLQDREWYRQEKRTQRQQPGGAFRLSPATNPVRRFLRPVLGALVVVFVYEFVVRPFLFG